jgi:hypothetical protein
MSESTYNSLEKSDEELYAVNIQDTLLKVDASNLTSEGKSTITSYSFPSTTYVGLTVDVSGSTYNVPANGFVAMKGVLSSTSNFMRLEGIMGTALYNGLDTEETVLICLPVVQNEVITYKYSLSSVTYLRFIYAKGEI